MLIIAINLLRMGKVKLREVNWVSQDHAVSKKQNQDSAQPNWL